MKNIVTLIFLVSCACLMQAAEQGQEDNESMVCHPGSAASSPRHIKAPANSPTKESQTVAPEFPAVQLKSAESPNTLEKTPGFTEKPRSAVVIPDLNITTVDAGSRTTPSWHDDDFDDIAKTNRPPSSQEKHTAILAVIAEKRNDPTLPQENTQPKESDDFDPFDQAIQGAAHSDTHVKNVASGTEIELSPRRRHAVMQSALIATHLSSDEDSL